MNKIVLLTFLAIEKIKRIVDKIGDSENAGYNRSKSQVPKFNDNYILGCLTW